MQIKLNELAPAALSLLLIGVIIGVGAEILTDVQAGFVTDAAGCNSTDTSLCGTAYNATGDALSGMGAMASWLPTVGLVIAAAVIIGILVYAFAFNRGGGQA